MNNRFQCCHAPTQIDSGKQFKIFCANREIRFTPATIYFLIVIIAVGIIVVILTVCACLGKGLNLT